MKVTALELAQRFNGLEELEGAQHHPFIQWCFTLCGYGPNTPDEVPWCSAFAQAPAFLLGLPRSHSASARSWLRVGKAVGITEAEPGFDVVVLQRGDGPQPGPQVLAAPGHVGYYAGRSQSGVIVFGGNQSDAVTTHVFPASRVLGIRRLI